MKKYYLSDLLKERYKGWDGKKIFLCAPTGSGKTTFIVEHFLPFMKLKRKKTLILCNRRLLRSQYWFDLVKKYISYYELEDCVTVKTYQQLADEIKMKENLDLLFRDYGAIVCDETHYFYSDSDFNGFGTYALLQAIVHAGVGRTMIFMTATAQEVYPLIKTTAKNFETKMDWKKVHFKNYCGCGEIELIDYSFLADYSRFKCIYIPDQESLYDYIIRSDKKTLIFIDSISEGKKIAKDLSNKGQMHSGDISFLTAENMEQNTDLVASLAISHRIPSKFLITTAVLDNGVSLHDPDIGNVIIFSESRVSFLQMIGRVRAECVDSCNLIFVPRKAEIYKRRMVRYEEECALFKKIQDDSRVKSNPYKYFSAVWDSPDSDEAKFLRKALVIARHDYIFYTLPETRVHGLFGDAGLYLNEFARCKTGDMYVSESKFYSLAVDDPLKVVYEQMSWINKELEELSIFNSTYLEKREEKFVKHLLSVQNYTSKDLKDFKVGLVADYHNDFFCDVLVRNKTISTEKLANVCERYGLKLNQYTESTTRQERYSIVKINELEVNE